MPTIPDRPKRSLWKTARWVILGALVLVIFLMLRKPAPVARAQDTATAKRNADQFTEKIQRLADAKQSGESAEARFTADEINATLQQATAETAAVTQAVKAVESGQVSSAPPPIQTTQVFFQDDSVVGQFQTQLYGKDVVVTVAGRLGSQDGYVTFTPTQFKIGDMPVPVSLVDGALQRKLAEPENREKLKLPPFVSGIRIERGELVIVEK